MSSRCNLLPLPERPETLWPISFKVHESRANSPIISGALAESSDTMNVVPIFQLALKLHPWSLAHHGPGLLLHRDGVSRFTP